MSVSLKKKNKKKHIFKNNGSFLIRLRKKKKKSLIHVSLEAYSFPQGWQSALTTCITYFTLWIQASSLQKLWSSSGNVKFH